MIVIGLSGLAGAGKTTLAERLVVEHRFVRVPFAGPLKAMAEAFGLLPREINGPERERPSTMLGGKTPRQFLQLLGTEFGREMIHQDIWVQAWRRRVRMLADRGQDRFVADDVRFDNEVAAIRVLGGRVLRVERHGAGSISGSGHASERGCAHDGVVVNHGEPSDVVAASIADQLAAS